MAALPKQQHRTSPLPRDRLSFNRRTSVYLIPDLESFTDDELDRIYFNEADTTRFQRDAVQSIFTMRSEPDRGDDDDYTSRGLEHVRDATTIEARKNSRQQVIHAVLDEQDRQWDCHNDVVDPNALAVASTRYSIESVEEARTLAEADEEIALIYNPRPAVPAKKDDVEGQGEPHDSQQDASNEPTLTHSVSSASIQNVLTKVLSMSDLTTLGVTTATSTPQTCMADLRRRPSQQLFNTINTPTSVAPDCHAMRKVPSKTGLPLSSTAIGGGMALLPNRRCTSLLDMHSLSAQEELAAKESHYRRPLSMGLPSSMGLDPIFQEEHEDEDVLSF